MVIFAHRLKNLRNQLNLSQEELGKMLGVSKVSISKYENGLQHPDLEKLLQLSDIFGVSIDYLLGKEDIIYIPKLKNDGIKERTNYLYVRGKKENLTQLEGERLLEELEMFRLYKNQRKKK